MRLNPQEVLTNCANRLKERASESGPASEALANEIFIIHSLLKYLAKEWNNTAECNLHKATAISKLYIKLATINRFEKFKDLSEVNTNLENNEGHKLQLEAVVVEILDIIDHESFPPEQVNTIMSGLIECLDACNQAEIKMFS